MTTASDLREQITFREKTLTDLGGGNFEETWTDAATVAAAVAPIGGEERFQAQQLENPTDYTVTIRYPRGAFTPDEAMRIKWRGRNLGIRNIHWTGPSAAFLKIDAQSGVSAEA